MKRQFSVQSQSIFCEFSSTAFNILGPIPFSPKIKPFPALSFILQGFFAQTTCNVRGNDREHLSLILSERAHGVGINFMIFCGRGDDTVNCGPPAYA